MMSYIIILVIAIIAAELLRYTALFFMCKAFSVQNPTYGTTILIGFLTSVLLVVGGLLVSLVPAPTLVTMIAQVAIWILSMYVFHLLLKHWYHSPGTKNLLLYAIYSLISFVVIVLLLVFLRFMTYTTVEVTSTIMQPSFQPGNTLLFTKVASAYRRGDVVVFRSTAQDSLHLGRIVGMPGETVAVHNGAISINGVLADESSYLGWLITTPGEFTLHLGDNEYWMLPDNRLYKADEHPEYSRAIDRQMIWGRYLSMIPKQ
jgi:signal peptidase I